MADVLDGTSSTVMVSEILAGDTHSIYRVGEVCMAGAGPGSVNLTTVATWAQTNCLPTSHLSTNGNNWLAPLPTQTIFNMVATPNWQFPTCEYTASGYAADRDGVFPHAAVDPGGVNCVVRRWFGRIPHGQH